MKDNGIEVNLPLVKKDISEPLNSNEFGLFLAQEWKRLISLYTPRREGILEDTAIVRPFEIEYKVDYDFYVYYGEYLHFRTDGNPYATYKWDKAAENAGQKNKLASAANKWLWKNT